MSTDKTNQTCPYCKENIKAGAVKCKHCGSKLVATSPSHDGVCPYCKEEIHKEAIKCKHCQSNLTVEEDCGCGHSVDASDFPNSRRFFEDSSLSNSAQSPTEFETFQSRFSSTLPKCRWVRRLCGSSLPGSPPIYCYDYVCTYGGVDTIVISRVLALV